MENEADSHLPPSDLEYGTFKTYVWGFIASLLLTLAAYFCVTLHLLSDWMLDGAVALFALVQACIQLQLFYHLTKEPKPNWNLLIFLFMAMVVGIIVFASIWIMYHLNYNLMPKNL